MDEHTWLSAAPQTGDILTLGNNTLQLLPPAPMYLVSGDLAAFASHCATTLPLIGFATSAPSGTFLLRLARDRALWINPDDDAPIDGWHNGVALSQANGAKALLQLEGPRAEHILAQGTSTDLSTPGPSAAIQFAGLTAALCRRDTRWWLFIDRPQLSYCWHWFKGCDH